MQSEQFCLKWNDFHSNLSSSFGLLRNENYLEDITLVTDDHHQIAAHKLVLSACSEYFRNVLSKNSHSHPMLCLDGVTKGDLINVIDYVYYGQVQIHQDNLDQFLQIAQKFQLQGLQHSMDSSMKHENIKDNNEEKNQNEIVNLNYEVDQKQNNIIQKKEYLLLSDEFNSMEELNQKIEESIVIKDGLKHCSFCEYQSKSNCHVKEHIELHFKLIFPCSMCDKSYTTRNNLRSHIARYHKNNSN